VCITTETSALGINLGQSVLNNFVPNMSMSKLKGVANSMAQSFNSLMNFSNDYVMEIISEQMKKKHIKKVTINILKETVTPKTLSTENIMGIIPIYQNMLDKQMGLSNRSLDDVKSAKFTIVPTGKQRENWSIYAVECEIVLKNGQKSIGRKELGWLEKTPTKLLNVKDIQLMRNANKKPNDLLPILLMVIAILVGIMAFYFGTAP